jgi:hypothetical protein
MPATARLFSLAFLFAKPAAVIVNLFAHKECKTLSNQLLDIS